MLNIEFEIDKIQNIKMLELLKTATRVASTQAGILISGDHGTGKSSLCRWIHHQSRPTCPYLVIECRDYKDLPPQFSELFRRGRNGTIVFENIDQASPAFQMELLSTLDSVGVDERPRILCTSTKELRSLARQELFRQDLYFKLVVVSLDLPALSERTQDIPSLVDFLLQVNAIIYGKKQIQFSSEAMEKLMNWGWPGNIRELENVVERAVALSGNTSSEICLDLIRFEPEPAIQNIDFSPGMSLSDVEKRLIIQTLELTAQNRTKAAQLLGISIRTLRNKLNEYREAGVYEHSI